MQVSKHHDNVSPTEFFVSIIVPVYNGEKTLALCINSLLALDYPKNKYEIIIVDNNSTDRTRQIINACPVRYVSEHNIQTSYAARNAGVRVAAGDILAFTDSDCVVSKDWLKKSIPGFRNQKVGCVAGEVNAFSVQTPLEKLLVETNYMKQSNFLKNSFLPFAITANAIYRKEVFDRIGFFNKLWVSGGDSDFAWRMQIETNYTIQYIPEAMVFHIHKNSLKSMYRQNIKWGYGWALRYLNHRKDQKNLKKHFKQTPCTKIAKETLALIFKFAQSKLTGRAFSEKDKYLVPLLRTLGLKIGWTKCMLNYKLLSPKAKKELLILSKKNSLNKATAKYH